MFLAPRGKFGFVTGTADRKPLPIEPRRLLLGKSMHGIVEGGSNPDVFIPLLIDLYMDGRFPFDRLVTFYPFEAIAQAFHDVESGASVKPILRIGDAPATA